MSSCLGFGRKHKQHDEEALLPLYADDTSMQKSLHQKMHSYQMFRAMGKGFMPSTEQLIVNLRTLLALDVLNPGNPDLSDSGRLLVKYSKQWITQFIELLKNKNGDDQIQDFIWYLTKSRVYVNTEGIANRAANIKSKADTAAGKWYPVLGNRLPTTAINDGIAYESLRTVGSLLLTNSDFRIFMSDLGTIGKQVFADTAFSLSNVAEEIGREVEPSEEESKTVKKPGADDGPPPTKDEVQDGAAHLSAVVSNGLAKTGSDALSSMKENVTGDQKETLLNRLKQAVIKLRKRNDYSDSVSTIGTLIQRYAKAYYRAADQAISSAQDEVNTNAELDRAGRNFWHLLSSFGNRKEWEKLEQNVNKVMEHSQSDPDFESIMEQVGAAVQRMLSDPSFFDSADKTIQELREKIKDSDSKSRLREDIEDAITQSQITLNSVLTDKDVSNLITTTTRILKILSPLHTATNPELLNDSLNIFLPLLINTIQYIPIPRIEVSVPEVDLLLENLIIEAGRTINHTSFLPYKLRIETKNDFELRKAKFRVTSSVTSLITIKLDGMSVRADDVGFWLRAHSGIFRLADEGIASFQLDERGIDIALDMEIGREKLEQILTLKAVRVHVHKLDFTLRKSKFSFLSWILKPILRPILRRTMQKQLATAIADFFHAANRELLFARERLRATRISDPQDVRTFIKALITRLTPEEDPDLYTAVGVRPSEGVFKGVYAPGSVVKLWEEEARQAAERVDDYTREGWRNEIFDVQTRAMTDYI